MAFRQSDGAVVWKSGDFLTSGAAPLLIEIGGRPQVGFLAGSTITIVMNEDGDLPSQPLGRSPA